MINESNADDQQPRTFEDCRKQYDDIRRQTDNFLKKNVIQTDPVEGIIQWSMWSTAPGASGTLGHGFHYHDVARQPENDLVAFVQYGQGPASGIWQGYYIQPDAITTPDVIIGLKQIIEKLFVARELQIFRETWITDRICARKNS
jgi:hypothetical protein